MLGTPPAFILSQDQTLQLKIAIVAPEAQRSFQARVLITRTHSVSVARSEDQMTEVRWFLSIQFSKSLVPWRAYQSRALGSLCQALFGALTGARLPFPHDMGSATIRKRCATVNPLRKVFPAVSVGLPETELTTREKVREFGGENKRWGKSSKARKACLGWNSRQDGGRLVERS